MRKDLEKKYINSMCEDYTKEQLAEMIMRRNSRICEIRAFLNQLFAGSSSITFYECVEKLKELKEDELADNLNDVKRYLTGGNKFLNSWVEGE